MSDCCTHRWIRVCLSVGGSLACCLALVACSDSGPGTDPSDPDTRYTTSFASDAFPPVMPPDANHGGGSYGGWQQENCLSCHREGVNDAPKVVHAGMAPILLEAKCRSCHTSTEPTQ